MAEHGLDDNPSESSVADAWRRALRDGGYEPPMVRNRLDCQRACRLGKAWRLILNSTQLKPGSAVFEAGCGGGGQLVRLASHGYSCTGLDGSPEVLQRCRTLISGIESVTNRRLPIRLVEKDFLEFSTSDTYQLAFNFGVVEHFLDTDERNRFIRGLFDLVVPGGFVVSVVPSGAHPLRARMRSEGLGGYRIPEIDYTCESIARELEQFEPSSVRVIPHDLFGYRLVDPFHRGPARVFLHILHKSGRLLPRVPGRFACRHATSLIAIAQKPHR